MKKKDLPSEEQKVARILREHKPPSAKYDPHSKKISVTYDFGLGLVPGVRVIADREKWLDWWERLENIQFSDVADYVKPKKKKEALEKFSNEEPSNFLSSLYTCVDSASYVNPRVLKENRKGQVERKLRRKPRGGSYKDKTPREMDQIRLSAAHLYHYLQANRKHPDWLEPLLSAYGFSPSDLKGAEGVLSVTKSIIENVFNFSMKSATDGVNPLRIFYQEYICARPLKAMKNNVQRRREGALYRLIQTGKTPALERILSHKPKRKSLKSSNMTSIVPPLPPQDTAESERRIKCEHYEGCLNDAAHRNRKLRCIDCKRYAPVDPIPFEFRY